MLGFMKKEKKQDLSPNLSSLSPGDKSLPDIPCRKHRRSLDIIPILLGKRIDAENIQKNGLKVMIRNRCDKSTELKRSNLEEGTCITFSSSRPSCPWICVCSY